jgi:hypothetical protein
MSAFNHKYNTDDVIFRAVMVGLLNSLNQRIFYENVWEDDSRETVNVPFYFGMGGDERFLQDYFVQWSECKPYYPEGNYDRLPRANIVPTGISVLPAEITSQFVRGFYVKEEEGELRRKSSYLSSIPLQMTYDVTVAVDTLIDSWKVVQSIITTLYYTLTYRVNFKGTVVPCQAGFPDNYSVEKLMEFKYDDNTRPLVKFPLEVQAYLPVFDIQSTLSAASHIRKFQIVASGETHSYTIDTLSVGLTADMGSESLPDSAKLKKDDPNAKYGGNYWE